MPILLDCFFDDDLIKTAIPIFGALVIAIVVYSLNKEKEKELRIGNLKNEIVGLCDRITRFSASREAALLDHMYFAKMASDKSWNNATPFILSLAQEHYNRSNDLFDKFTLAKSDLIKNASNLFLYTEAPERDLILTLLLEFDNQEINEPSDNYRDISEFENLKKLHEKNREDLKSKIASEEYIKPLKELQQILNPTFFSAAKKSMKK